MLVVDGLQHCMTDTLRKRRRRENEGNEGSLKHLVQGELDSVTLEKSRELTCRVVWKRMKLRSSCIWRVIRVFSAMLNPH